MKPKRTIAVPKPPSTQKMWIVVGVALFLLIFFVILYSGYKAGAGKAIEIKPEQAIPSFVDLAKEDSLVFKIDYFI